MSRFAESLSRFFGRVEILARGADDDRRAAEEALQHGRPLEARTHVRSLLARVPRSPLGLALLADAAEASGLDAEVVEALSQLVKELPWRPEIWLRLGEAGQRVEWPHARDALERAAAGDNAAVRRRALLQLADQDIAAGETERARRWLERLPYHESQEDPELALRRAECHLEQGEIELARRWEAHTKTITDGGRIRMVRARLGLALPAGTRGDHPIGLATAAYLLEARGSAALLAELVARCRDAVLISRVRDTLAEQGKLQEPRWQAAFALAEGRREDARSALVQGLERGDAAAAISLLSVAVEQRDAAALRLLREHAEERVPAGHRTLLAALSARDEGDDATALRLLEERADDPAVGEWALELLQQLVSSWVRSSQAGGTRWEVVLAQLRTAATQLDQLTLVSRCEALAVERERPLYVAVLGEFNAGKSTLLNALLGTDVAPTGVRPTTASLHWVGWAPDPFARVVVHGEPDRVVQHAALKDTLEQVRRAGQTLDRAYIYAPIERLKRIELLDTPGFNAPDASHAQQARQGVEEAHVALWLLDATAPLKNTERRIIEEIAASGVPVQVLVNKRDRLQPEQLTEVMGYIQRSLSEVSIHSIQPPLAFSAKAALAGKLGDAEALRLSGWTELEELLARHIVNRRDVLREHALRRKAAAVAKELLGYARSAAERVEAGQRAAEQARDWQRQLAAELRRAPAKQVQRLRQAIEPALRELAEDLRPVEQLAPERRADPSVRQYVVERSCARLSEALLEPVMHGSSAVAALPTGAPRMLRPALRSSLRALISGAASAQPAGQQLSEPALMATLEAALSVAAELLDALPSDYVAPAQGPASHRRLAALHAALTTADEASSAQQQDRHHDHEEHADHD